MRKTAILLVLGLIALPALAATENFTMFTEVDPGSTITVAAGTITCAATALHNTDTYVYKDYGVGHFSGDFTHKFLYHPDSVTARYCKPALWCLANSVDDLKAIDDAGGEGADYIAVRHLENLGSITFSIELCQDGGLGSTAYGTCASDTDYYITVVRDDDGGANSTGRVTLYICTGNYYGEAGASLLAGGPKYIDCAAGEQNDFRYLFMLNSYNDGNTYTFSGTLSNLDIGEIAPANKKRIIHRLYRDERRQRP